MFPGAWTFALPISLLSALLMCLLCLPGTYFPGDGKRHKVEHVSDNFNTYGVTSGAWFGFTELGNCRRDMYFLSPDSVCCTQDNNNNCLACVAVYYRRGLALRVTQKGVT